MITSTHNPKIQHIRGLLARSKDRREANAFVVEGVRLAEEALKAGWQAKLVLHASDLNPRGAALVEAFQASGAEAEAVSDAVMKSVSDTETPQGILAVLSNREPTLPDTLNFTVIADTIRDPGNLGTLLRTAAAAGIQAALLSPETVDPFSPKVLRAAMGAHFRIPVLKMEWDSIRTAISGTSGSDPLTVYLADMDGEQAYWEPDFRKPVAIMVGSEAEGASGEGRELAHELVRIPMPGEAESLNAAVAAAVLMFEVVRQRSLAQS